MSCDVRLISYTRDPVRVVAAAAKLCYSPSTARGLFDGLDDEAESAFIERLRASGHLSPFEHASFTFTLDGLSRVASHQLVRHRIASFSQQSQRYVTEGEPRVVVPRTVAENDAARALFEEAARSAHDVYRRLVELGVPKEDARFVLPHGWRTSLVVTMNARELGHFFALRTCRRAQWEIRGAARAMLRAVLAVAEPLFARSGPSCVTEGACREERPCGRPYSCIEELLDDD